MVPYTLHIDGWWLIGAVKKQTAEKCGCLKKTNQVVVSESQTSDCLFSASKLGKDLMRESRLLEMPAPPA